MSKADQLGSGRFGGAVRTVSARRQAVAAATGVPTEGIAPPTELPVQRISPNPDNPRSTLGDLTDLAGSLKTHGQKQAITVMNRDAYVKINPERETDLEPDTTHVVIDGSSRLAAAREAGLATLKVMVSDEQGTTPEELLESALVANIHRQDLEELDEARALQRLLDIHGSQRALAKRLHRSQGWISQRLALLKLSPELQARIGQEPIDLLRAVGNKPTDQQKAALEELKAERASKEEAARASKHRTPRRTSDADEHDTGSQPAASRGALSQPTEATTPVATPAQEAEKTGRHYDVMEDDGSGAPPSATSPRHETGDEPARTGERATALPVQSTAAEATAGGEQQLKRFPYEDGESAAMYLIHRMSPVEFEKMLDRLIAHRDSRAVSAG
ncbi:ParB/RepB/Spo0J family partition protein [Streptomyces indiaensis]|uniref:ParB/RepB/Spo0J family partition protein n=1 Tax=Streptomyces indiaensis TaxID=284033 RepID=A0ABN3DA18_9ACTN|nr:ParB/RepB/Spo0J family partition protein [Streptomyces indiaensis]MCF1646044.1 ParB/RepB/Spo0J family partition protein [Streptomyces indiaensis]